MFRPLLFLLMISGGPAMADLHACRQMFSAAPDALGGLPRMKSFTYEDDYPGLGFSVGYVGPASKVTVYFYDHQKDTVPSGVALDSFKQSARDMMRGIETQGFEPGPIKAYQLKNESRQFRLRAETETAQGRSDFLVLGVVEDCIVKLRFTAEQPMQGAKTQLNAILTELKSHLGKPI